MAVAAVLAVPAAFAQPVPPPLQIADAVGLRFPAFLQPLVSISPDETVFAYTVCDPRRVSLGSGATGMSASQLGIIAGCVVYTRAYDKEGGRFDGEEAAIEHDGPAWAPSWSPDGRRLAFYGIDPDGVHIWIWDRALRTVRKANAEAVRLTGGRDEVPLWSADGRSLFSKISPQSRPQPVNDSSVAAWARPAPGGSTVEVFRSDPNAAADLSFAAPHPPTDIAALDADGGGVRRLSREVRTVMYWLSPDRRYLAYSRNAGTPSQSARTYQWDLDVIDLADGSVRTLASFHQWHGQSVRWAPDSRSLAFFSGERNEDSASLFVVDVDGAKPRALPGVRTFNTALHYYPVWTAGSEGVYAVEGHTLWRGGRDGGALSRVGSWPGYKLGRVLTGNGGSEAWSPDGGATVYLNARDGKTKRWALLEVTVATGAARALGDEALSIGGNYGYPLVAPGGRFFIYSARGAGKPGDVWIAPRDFRHPRQLTHLNPELERYAFGAQRLIEFTSRDGTPLQATLLLPTGYKPGQRYPLVTWVYGGDMGSDAAYVFGLTPMGGFNLQMLATRGYAVLYPDIPLTTGHHIDSLMNAVMPAIDATVAAGIVDPRRLAVMGQSAGGYATLSLVTRTHRFKAAIMCAGFGELASFYGHGWTAWSETGRGALGAAPWEAPQRYVENSPVYALDRIETPLLIEAGEKDEAVGDFPKHVFTSLRRLEKDATYLRYRDEGHALFSHANLVDFWDRAAAFLDHHLQP